MNYPVSLFSHGALANILFGNNDFGIALFSKYDYLIIEYQKPN